MCRFPLYPYVSSEFYWEVHEEAVERLQAGTPHPYRTKILAWNATVHDLARMEKEGADISQIMTLQNRIDALHSDLQVQEVTRIEENVRRLYQWHSG